MPRSARLLALGALLALSCAGAAQAACVADPDYGYGDGSSGCKNCTADGARCETCWEGWGLTKSGECKECLPKLKVDGSMSRATSVCTSCDGDAPDICTACGPFCNTPGCFGYFLPEVKAGVYCTPCPISGCADCKDLTGNCIECRPGLGLVDGECRGCRDEDCKTCDGNLSKCTECRQPKPMFWEGLYLDAAGKCTKCPSGCRECNLTADGKGCELCADGSADKCQSCLLGYTLNSATQQCEPVACKVAGCLSCEDDASRCDPEIGCGAGKWYDEASNTCSPCSEGCADCSKFGCGRCSDGYWMDAATRKCNKCTAGDTHAAC
ncbi:REJ domain [Chlorella sorokiniana]|uniref:REJ domain n=1 Tax=Chlorella sorokiniana TaxID=3076 RepID=A0A2P6U0G9_CHLSO|nr:REJ domain [Chlorella sorokiniana]|eukprot:PRW59821.1 REJ domain [Chlorella sorokiniana]